MQICVAPNAIHIQDDAMNDADLNLLTALDALLAERSVTGAAKRLGLSVSAMSRTLSRLRALMGDPLLAPAGRGMVLTPYAEAVSQEARDLNVRAHAILRPAPAVDVATLQRSFTIRANEAFVMIHAARLSGSVAAAAPGVRLNFVPKPDKDIRALRDGGVDLEIGVVSGDAGELRAQTLYRDVFAGVARAGHPILDAPVTAAAFAACGHVAASRRNQRSMTGPVEAALAEQGLSRDIRVTVPSFPAALALIAASDLIGAAPRSFAEAMQVGGVRIFDLPFALPGLTISQIWHPRMDADGGHKWLRGLIFAAFRS